MVRTVTKEGIASILARGGSVTPVPKEIPPEVRIEGMSEAIEKYHQVKHEKMKAWSENHAAKLAKLDELIKAVKNQDLAEAMKQLVAIQTSMLELKVAHEAREAIEDLEDLDDDDDEPCTYKLTGKRDRRGFIDIEYGLTFTPVKNDE